MHIYLKYHQPERKLQDPQRPDQRVNKQFLNYSIFILKCQMLRRQHLRVASDFMWNEPYKEFIPGFYFIQFVTVLRT